MNLLVQTFLTSYVNYFLPSIQANYHQEKMDLCSHESHSTRTSAILISNMSDERRLRPTKVTLIQHMEELSAKIELDIERKKKASEPHKNLASYLKTMERLLREAHAIPPKIKKEADPEKAKASAFNKPVEVTPELAKFLRLEEGDEVNQTDIGHAIRVYMHRKNPLVEGAKRWAFLNDKKPYRDLRDPENRGFFLPDATIEKLLKTKQYEKDVKAGKVICQRKNPTFVGRDTVVETDPRISNKTLMRLYNKLIIRPEKAKKPKAKSGKPKGKAKKVVAEEEEEEEDDEVVKPKKTTKVKGKPKKVDEEEEEEEEDEEEEEEEVVKPKKTIKVKGKPKKVVVEEDDEEEDDE